MFGQQKNDENGAQNTTNPALPGSFPALPHPTDSGDNGFNPALPSSDANRNDNQAESTPTESTPALTAPASHSEGDSGATGGTKDDLLDIKQKALSQLSPLVSHLDQTPEEKFKTTMMMIQATDNQDLVKDAYAAAQNINDEKAKAQALLDIVNEINYFTQHHQA